MRQFRTPLRYPGGKQRLAPFIQELLAENDLIGGHYVEPYAGGAGIALELLLDDQVKRIHLNDSSGPIYAFWHSVLTQPDELCRRIAATPLNVDEWKKWRVVVRDPADQSEVDVGFGVLYLNRCNRSGVLTGGLIGGLEQTGEWKMDARFHRKELVRRIEAIAARSDSVTLHHLDAEEFMIKYVQQLEEDTLVYCDPPYFSQASRLYLHQYRDGDHARVAKVIQEQLSHKWVVSYDSAPEITQLYRDHRSFSYDLQYSASRAYQGREVLIFSDDLDIPSRSSLPNIDRAMKEWRESETALLE